MATFTQTEVNNRLGLIYPKAQEVGFKVDETTPDYCWEDLIGKVLPNTSNPTTSPTISEFRTGIYAYAYTANDRTNAVYHIPHDWVMDSDSFIHLHWAHNGTTTTGNLSVTMNVTYASADGGTVFSAPTTLAAINVNTVDIATTPQYKHMLTEIPLTTQNPTANEIDRSLIEVDGLFILTFTVNGIPTLGDNGEVFIFTADIHYQSRGIGTKNKSTPFYT